MANDLAHVVAKASVMSQPMMLVMLRPGVCHCMALAEGPCMTVCAFFWQLVCLFWPMLYKFFPWAIITLQKNEYLQINI